MSSFVNGLLSKLFPKEEKAIEVSEPIQWNEELEQRFVAWKPEGAEILRNIRSDIARQRVIDESILDLQWLEDRAADGFSANLSSLIAKEDDLKLLGRLISERIKSLNYRLYTAEHKRSGSASSHESRYWYYHKPIPNIEEGQVKHDQRYGNIKIDLWENQSVMRIRFLRTIYAGHNYSTPLPLEALLEGIFDPD